MDISRRSFLKLSLGGLLAAAASTNPVLAAISNSVAESPYKVFLYLIQTKSGKWKVKGTTCINIDKVYVPSTKFNKNTFKPLGVYTESESNDKKLQFWNQYNCGYGFQKVNYQLCINNGNNAKLSGQLNCIHSMGGKKTLPKGVHTEIQKNGNKKLFEIKKGIHDPKYKNKKLEWNSAGGKVGGKSCVNQSKGIHVDKDTRKQWARLGGLAVVDNLNKEQQCPHCGKTTKGAGYYRWHGNKCKNNKQKYLDISN